MADGLGIVRIGDIGITDCGHHFVALAGSSISEDQGLAIVRVGDPVSVIEGGDGTVITGSDTTESD